MLNSIIHYQMLFPYHKYLGPGNEINYDEPVDDDDRLALLHDLDYIKVKNDKEVSDSDSLFVNEFFKDFIHTGNWHSLFGTYGLSTKFVFEKLFGNVYGMPHKGQELYAKTQKELSAAYKEEKRNNPHLNWNDFQKYFHQKRKADDSAIAGPSKRQQQQDSAVAEEPNESDNENDDNISAFSFEWPGSDSFRQQGDADILTRTVPFRSDSNMAVNMDIGEIAGDVSSGASGAPTGGTSFADGTGTSGLIKMYKSVSCKPVTLNFRKSYIMYSYGYSFEKLIQDKGIVHTTPLSYVPVDCVCSYMTPQEFHSLPMGCKVTEVRCAVKILGVRTSFDVGTTLTGTANSEHVPIGVCAIGLNHKLHMINASYECTADKPMIPTSYSTFNAGKYQIKMYTSKGCLLTGCPRSNSNYLAYLTNSESQVPKHTKDNVCLGNYTNRFHVGSHVGQTVVRYSYKPKRGFLNSLKEYSLPGMSNGASLDTNFDANFMIQERIIKTAKEGCTAMNKDSVPFDKKGKTEFVTGKTFDYLDPIEKIYVVSPHMTGPIPMAQPQVHVGLMPTPKLNPATENTDFQNSCIYYEVVFDMNVEQDIRSAYASGKPEYLPSNVLFGNNGSMVQDGGQFLLGYWNSGNL